MPELPEVEHSRRVVEAFALGRRIAGVVCEDDTIVFEGRAGRDVEYALRYREVRAVRRRGKYLWLELEEGPHPVFHLGMTGAFRHHDDRPLKLESSIGDVDGSWPPRFTKVCILFDDGGELAFTNARRLGRVMLRESPPDEPPIAKLGFDPLTDMPSAKKFAGLLARRKGVLKGLLLDQSFAAGVGNWIADEVLFQAGIDPRRTVDSLSAKETKRLRDKIRHVVHTAVKVDARATDYPKSWLFHHRWGKDASAKTSRGEPIEHLTVAGRTTAWVPSRQR